MQQCNTAGAVRVILDGSDLGGNAILDSLEVNDAVLLLVATTAVTAGFAAVAIATTGAALRCEQRLLRRRLGDVAEVGARLEATAG